MSLAVQNGFGHASAAKRSQGGSIDTVVSVLKLQPAAGQTAFDVIEVLDLLEKHILVCM